MAIIKPGFTVGFRGRVQAPGWNRRAHYLASEHDRDSARLLGMAGQELEPSQAIEALGGPRGHYHEIIVAPSTQECATIRARCPENPQRAAAEAGNRIAKAYAQGRPYILAIHEQDGRCHFHVAVAGSMSERALGRHGQIQKAWHCEIFGDEPRIQDWAAHLRFKEEKAHLQQVIREQKENELQRREAVKRAASGHKTEAARPFEMKARALIERRYTVELRAIQARYEARGASGSPRHQVELEQAGHRRSGALRRLEKRETDRELGAIKASLGRAVNTGGRVAQRDTRALGSIGRVAIDQAMKAMGVPAPVRTVTRSTMVLGEEAIQTALRASLAAAKAAAQSSVHIAQASMKLGVGLMAALPTGGASLQAAGGDAAQDLAKAGKELGQGAAMAGVEIGKGAARTATTGTHEFLPREMRLAVSVATTAAKTGVGVVKDALTLSPLDLGKTLAGGAMEFGKCAASAAGIRSTLPEPLRRAFQLAGWIPVVGIAAKATELATGVAHTAITAASRGMEVDR